MGRLIDLTGQRFGRLVVTQRLEKQFWECQCDCGNAKAINGASLRRGLTQSCGCLQKERARGYPPRHGHSPKDKPSPAYIRWQAMLSRCYYPKNASYASYGGRGITVCDRWRNSFENFYADMGAPPLGTTLERFDNDGNYTPENCRWATALEQGQNRRTNTLITFQGVTQTLAAWERALGYYEGCLAVRLRLGWTIERALTTPVKPRKPRKKA